MILRNKLSLSSMVLSIVMTMIVLMIAGCGFRPQSDTEIPEQFKKITFYSADPYGSFARELKSLLKYNGVIIEHDSTENTLPSLRLSSNNIDKNTISVYKDGKAAEYQLILSVDAQVVISGEDIYPLSVKVFKTFFDNPATPLAKNTEQMLIEQEMYEQAAIQLVRKLKTINPTDQKVND